ncbi:hypothetical protein LTS18_009573 [Coniosporium uncinatum]|uniref:Uncharacterized protein n=1 Tax=Coniosporium uncinatum TaxID=93489 RepID=A0ACC3D0Q5_9PEZI|nr:hypothetical protein LTS18_009573 [Coniosporium uncinatum]
MLFWSKKQAEKASLRVMPRITPPAPTVIAPNSVTWRDYMNIKDEVKKLREKDWETMEKWMEADTNGVEKYAAKNQQLEKLVRGLRHQVDEYAAKSQAVQPQLQESESMVALLIDELFQQQQECRENQKARAAEKTALEHNVDTLSLATANDRRDITHRDAEASHLSDRPRSPRAIRTPPLRQLCCIIHEEQSPREAPEHSRTTCSAPSRPESRASEAAQLVPRREVRLE